VDRLKGKVAIVTGAGTGIGRATAQLYAEEGARVVVADIRVEDGEEVTREINDAGGDAIFVKTDVSKTSDCKALSEAAESHFGGLHVLTANAGILGRGNDTSLVDIPEEDFEQIMGVNFYGVAWSFKYAIEPIRRSGGGALTATASLAAHRGMPAIPAYCASKAAVVGLVQSLAVALQPEIRVNAVSPGRVATNLMSHFEEETGRKFVSRPGSINEQPYARAADPRELAHAHLWLASDDNSFMTGETLMLDNGRSIRSA
jgi:NAD(P)-dependent dehydrogenase (short-subunit alcohol dehydrogenase family)